MTDTGYVPVPLPLNPQHFGLPLEKALCLGDTLEQWMKLHPEQTLSRSRYAFWRVDVCRKSETGDNTQKGSPVCIEYTCIQIRVLKEAMVPETAILSVWNVQQGVNLLWM